MCALRTQLFWHNRHCGFARRKVPGRRLRTPVCGRNSVAVRPGLSALQRERDVVQAGFQAGERAQVAQRRLQMRALPHSVQRYQQHDLCGLPHCTSQMAARWSSDLLDERGHQRASAAERTRTGFVSERVVYVAAHPLGSGSHSPPVAERRCGCGSAAGEAFIRHAAARDPPAEISLGPGRRRIARDTIAKKKRAERR